MKFKDSYFYEVIIKGRIIKIFVFISVRLRGIRNIGDALCAGRLFSEPPFIRKVGKIMESVGQVDSSVFYEIFMSLCEMSGYPSE